MGLRFKGNFTLLLGWSEGSYKLPLKLDFDKFESHREPKVLWVQKAFLG